MSYTLYRDPAPELCHKDYSGNKRFRVYHPAHGSLTVCAPDTDCAIKVAADEWERRWGDYDFYSKCEVWKG